ncbi:MAG: hypothetical protein QM724_05315 [Flavobacteriales bacterium]
MSNLKAGSEPRTNKAVMKAWYWAIGLMFLAQVSFGQDRIITHANDTIHCKMIEVQEGGVKFKYPNEEALTSISKNVVHKVIFSSGREQVISEKVIVKDENDWEKVQITNLESDVVGLKRVQTFTEKAKSATAMTSQGKVEKRTIEKLKKAAAKAGCHVVLIMTTSGRSGGFGGQVATSSMTGVGYSY